MCDHWPLAKKCDAWLRRGDCEDERFFRFLQQVIGDNEREDIKKADRGRAELPVACIVRESDLPPDALCGFKKKARAPC